MVSFARLLQAYFVTYLPWRKWGIVKWTSPVRQEQGIGWSDYPAGCRFYLWSLDRETKASHHRANEQSSQFSCRSVFVIALIWADMSRRFRRRSRKLQKCTHRSKCKDFQTCCIMSLCWSCVGFVSDFQRCPWNRWRWSRFMSQPKVTPKQLSCVKLYHQAPPHTAPFTMHFVPGVSRAQLSSIVIQLWIMLRCFFNASGRFWPKLLEEEISYLQKLRHPCLVSFLGFARDAGQAVRWTHGDLPSVAKWWLFVHI